MESDLDSQNPSEKDKKQLRGLSSNEDHSGVDELTMVESGERATGGQWGGRSMVNVESAEQEFKDL
ncbi:hypothetical protein K7432_014457, partial [Basidiobolus ranarum]